MKIRSATLILLAALVSGAARAGGGTPAFDPDAFPAEVRRSLHGAIAACEADGAGKVTFAPDTVQKRDLTGDGRDDYIVSFQDTQCAESQAEYCGTGGCELDILVTLPDGSIRSVFNDRVRSIEIVERKGSDKGPR